MLQKIAIIKTRQRLDIPDNGLLNESEALVWYREHFRKAKGKQPKRTFGFQYDHESGLIDFKYHINCASIQIYSPQPIDDSVPLDKEVIELAREINLPDWAVPVLRLVVLIGEIPKKLELIFPDHLIAPLGNFRVLIHPVRSSTLRKWRTIGETMGLLTSEIDMWKIPGIITTYGSKRKNTYEPQYWETFVAYQRAILNRMEIGKKGMKGLLVETAIILHKTFGWKCKPDSYTVRRYLDRAEKIWHISTY